ncbi:MAG: PilZ domain-containing protein [Thermoanaerobaculia bacterium]
METLQFKPRVGVEVLVTVVPQGGRSHLGRTGNLSPSGMLLQVGEELQIGHRLELKLFLPGTAKKIEMAGEVTREDSRGENAYLYGIRFIDLEPEVEAVLDRFLMTRLDRRRPS